MEPMTENAFCISSSSVFGNPSVAPLQFTRTRNKEVIWNIIPNQVNK